jgi:hypothetical protein
VDHDKILSSQVFEYFQDVRFQHFGWGVIFLRQHSNHFRHPMCSVAEFPNSMAYFVQRVVASVVHIEEQHLIRPLLGDNLLLPSGTAAKICVLFHFFSRLPHRSAAHLRAFSFAGAQSGARTRQHPDTRLTQLSRTFPPFSEGKESVWDSETSAPCPRIFLLPVRSETELGYHPQQAQTPQSWLDIDLHVSLSLFGFRLDHLQQVKNVFSA